MSIGTLGFGLTNTGAVNVTGTVTAAAALPTVGTGQTLVRGSVSAAATGTTVYTVTAGKTFYCTGITYSNSAAGGALASLTINSVAGRFPFNGVVGIGQCLNGGILFSCPATATIVLVHNSGGSNVNCAVWGYEA